MSFGASVIEVKSDADDDLASLGAEDDASYDAAFDRITAEGNDDETQDATVTEQKEAAKEPAPDDAEKEAAPEAKPAGKQPGNMAEIADIVTGLDPEKSAKLMAWADKQHRAISDAGRTIAAYKGFDAVVSQHLDHFKTPGAVPPQEAFGYLMQMSADMRADPLGTLRKLAKEAGVESQLYGEYQPNQETQELREVIHGLRNQIAQMGSPETIDQRIAQSIETREINRVVQEFTQKPFYGEVEEVLPEFVPIAQRKLGSGAAHVAVLDLAYDMAINADPELRQKAGAAAQAAAKPEPKKVEALRRATSINTNSGPTGGKQTYASEEEALGAAYDRVMAA
ncbi:MAG: hypothetical protein ACRC6I_18135 [Paracoccaceae bacterium]